MGSMDSNTVASKFYFKDCSLSNLVTGKHANTLKGLHSGLSTIHPGSIYNHFWGGRLRPLYEIQEYHNDFAMWAYHALRNQTLAERLAIIDPTDFATIEDLRITLLDVIQKSMVDTEIEQVALPGQEFYFMRSKLIIFDTLYSVEQPHELVPILPKIASSSIFYHFIDAYRRAPIGYDDFSTWLQGFGDRYTNLIQKIRKIDFYFLSLTELHNTLVDIFTTYFLRNPESQ